MTIRRHFMGAATVVLAAVVGGCQSAQVEPSTPESIGASAMARQPHPYVGMWVTADNHIRQELLPNGRYDEARGQRTSAYVGQYWITGTRIEYKDDTGFSADGEFTGDVLHHGGYVFYRQASQAHRDAHAARR